MKKNTTDINMKNEKIHKSIDSQTIQNVEDRRRIIQTGVLERHPFLVAGREYAANFLKENRITSIAFLGVGDGSEAVSVADSKKNPDIRKVVAVDISFLFSDKDNEEKRRQKEEYLKKTREKISLGVNAGCEVFVQGGDISAEDFNLSVPVEAVYMGVTLHDIPQDAQHRLLDRFYRDSINYVILVDSFFPSSTGPNYGEGRLRGTFRGKNVRPDLDQACINHNNWWLAAAKPLLNEEQYQTYSSVLHSKALPAAMDINGNQEQFETFESAKEKFKLHGYSIVKHQDVPNGDIKIIIFKRQNL